LWLEGSIAIYVRLLWALVIFKEALAGFVFILARIVTSLFIIKILEKKNIEKKYTGAKFFSFCRALQCGHTE
jgi:hypothetical protein